MLRWWRRSPRLIQSLPRSSSSMAPRMRWVAKVSNCTPCAASKRLSASVRPIMPTWIRSSSSTLAGSLAIIWCARRRTSGLYCLSIALASSCPLAVYMVSASIGKCGFSAGASRPARPRRRARRRRQAGRRPASSCELQLRRQQARAARRRAAARASPAGSMSAQSRSAAPRKLSAQLRQAGGDAPARGDRRRRRQQQVEAHQRRSAAPAASVAHRRA